MRTLVYGISIAALFAFGAPLLAGAQSYYGGYNGYNGQMVQGQTYISGNGQNYGQNYNYGCMSCYSQQPQPVYQYPIIPSAYPAYPPYPYPAGACYQFTRTLKFGSRGADVAMLQQMLQAQGFSINDPPGWYGESTASAVSGFQMAYANEILYPAGLRYGTGVVGFATRNKLNSLSGNCGVVPYPAAVPYSQYQYQYQPTYQSMYGNSYAY